MTTSDNAAAILRRATLTRTPVPPVRGLLQKSVDLAYEAQQTNIAELLAGGDVIVGRKIGLTSAAVQQQLGVDEPDFGTLLASMQVDEDAVVDCSRLLQPRIEAEVAFVLASDILELPLEPEGLTGRISSAHAALEIVDSRVAAWDIAFLDTVADNASSGLFVIGAQLEVDLGKLNRLRMRMYRGDEQVSVGTGADCLGGPLVALHWLARTMIERGTPLRSGDIVLSGALGPMCDVRPGDRFTATFNDGLSVHATFSRELV